MHNTSITYGRNTKTWWVDIDLAIRNGLTFYQTRSNAIIRQGIFSAYRIPKVVRLKTGEVLNEKARMSPRPPPKISLRHEWTRKVVRQPEGEVVRQAKFFQPTRRIPNPIPDRSGRPDKRTVAVQDDPEVYHEAETLNINDETLRERIEADMDFKIPGLPHSIVKHVQSTSVRELIMKIENHPNRHALQRDLRQSQSFHPFSPKSKQMIRDVGNIELCELLETEPKTQCKVCLSLGHWHRLLHVRALFCVKEEEKIRNSSTTRWTSFLFLTTIYRKGDLTGTVTGRSRVTGNILRPTS